MTFIPKRYSLVTKTAEVLQELLRKGEWGDYLPAQRVLCLQLQVSRSTLRHALRLLERDGFIHSQPRHGARIVQRQQSAAQRSKIVGVLRVSFSWEINNLSLLLLAELQRQLHLAGYEVRIFTDQKLGHRTGPGRIKLYTRQVNAACWVLLYSTRDVQRWLATQAIPALVVGHRYPGITLPFIDINQEAVCRQATEKLLALGHRHFALLLPNNQEASMLARERGFRRALELHTPSQATAEVLFHDQSVAGLRRTLDVAFRKSSPPTALVVADAWHALNAVSHLVRSGFRVPEDVSVISTDFELFLQAHVPPIDAYAASHPDFGSRLSGLVVQLAQVGELSNKPNWIVPSFRPGGTIGRPMVQPVHGSAVR